MKSNTALPMRLKSGRTNQDPITTFQSTMMEQGWLTDEEDTEIQNEVKNEITEAVRFAEESPFPTPDNVTTDVLAPEQEVA